MHCNLTGSHSRHTFVVQHTYIHTVLFIISVQCVANGLIRQQRRWQTDYNHEVPRAEKTYYKDGTGWSEWQGAVVALGTLICHHSKTVWQGRTRLWSFSLLLFQGFQARLLYSIFTHILPSFILPQLFLLPLVWAVQSAEFAAWLRWDNGVWHCFLVPVWIFCISAVYLCHLNLAFCPTDSSSQAL